MCICQFYGSIKTAHYVLTVRHFLVRLILFYNAFCKEIAIAPCNYLSCCGPNKPRTGTSPTGKGAVGVNVLTVDEFLQFISSLFSLCKMCNSNGSQKAALCTPLCTLGELCTLRLLDSSVNLPNRYSALC